jgi:hypothetical protein
MLQHGFGGPESKKCLILLVPGERIELPTNGLQNLYRHGYGGNIGLQRGTKKSKISLLSRSLMVP